MDRSLMVLTSGAGTTLENLCAKIHHRHLHARIVAVIGNHVNIKAADVAQQWRLPYWTLDPKVYPPRETWNDVLGDLVAVYEPALIVLAGFDQLLRIPPQYEERVINVHPSLLPRYGGKGFYGDRVHAAVLAAGDHETGCTVHLCDEEYDLGKILCSTVVSVHDGDDVETLRKRVQSAERLLYPLAIQEHLDYLESKNVY